MRATRLAAALAVAGLAACSYAYRNPAEQLRPGEVGGRTVAGGEVLLDGVAVAVKGAGLDATSRPNGRFAMMPLPVGRHTLMFRKGKERAVQREIEIAPGKDGQPQGLWLGDVEVPATASVRGEVAGPPGTSLAENGLVVDEVSGASAPVAGGGLGAFSLEGLSVGEHRLRIFATDAAGQPLVGGPLTVRLVAADAGAVVRLTRLTLHPASAAPAAASRMTLRFKVAGAASGLSPSDVQLTGLPQSLTFQPDGTAQVDVAEGLWTVGVKLPPGASGLTAPPPVTFVAVAGQVIDLGTLYAVTDLAAAQASRSCHADADCAPSACGAEGLCVDWAPPAVAPASVPWCDPSALGCQPGTPLGGVGKPNGGGFGPPYTMTCVGDSLGAVSAGVACGGACTPDGVTVLTTAPGVGGCPGAGSNPATAAGPGVWSSLASGTGAALHALWGANENDLWAVGGQGTILHWTGAAWTAERLFETRDFRGVWGSSTRDVWAVGSGGLMFHWDGELWSPGGGDSTFDANGIWGSSATDVWVVGSMSGAALQHWDGLTWRVLSDLPVSSLFGVWGSGPADVWAVGGQYSQFLHDDGRGWTSPGTSGPLESEYSGVWGSGPNDVWGVSFADGLAHFDGTAWTRVSTPSSTFNGVWGTSSSDVWAVGPAGTALRWDGSGWTRAGDAPPVDLFAVFGASTSDVWAVGAQGTILRWTPLAQPRRVTIAGQVTGVDPAGPVMTLSGPVNATAGLDASGAYAFPGLPDGTYVVTPSMAGYAFTPPSRTVVVAGGFPAAQDFTAAQAGTLWPVFATGRTTGLTAISGCSANDIWAAEGGTPLHWDGTSWTPNPTGYGYGASTLYCAGPGDVWATDGPGYVLHWGGTAWTAVVLGTGLNGLWASGPFNAWAVGSNVNGGGGEVEHFTGSTWTRTFNVTPWTLNAVWGSAVNDVWAVGDAGTIVHYDGLSWASLGSGTAAQLLAVWGTGPADAWAAGAGGILHWDGTGWRSSATGVSISGLWGSAADDVWAVGPSGILHWDGAAWTAVPSSVSAGLRGVWGSGRNDVWVVGDGGVVLHFTGSQGGPASHALSGTITGGPASGLSLALSGDAVSTSAPSAGGDYFFGALPSGSYTVTPSAPGYAFTPSSRTVIVSGGDAAGIDFKATPAAQPAAPTVCSVDRWCWERPLPQGNMLMATWVGGPADVWAVGALGTAIHWDGTAWHGTDTGVTSTLRAVWGTFGGEAWAVGDLGVVLRWDGVAWSYHSPTLTNALYGVWGTSSNDVWVVGSGTLLHWDGTSWANDLIAGANVLSAVWGSSASDVWAVGGYATAFVVHWDGTAWRSVAPGAGQPLNAVWGSGPNDVWAVGWYGDLAHWTGSAWAPVASGTGATLRGVWGAGASDVWAVGDGGQFLHWGGAAWAAADLVPASYLFGLGGGPGWPGLAVGERGDLYAFDGLAWTALGDGSTLTGRAVWGSGANDVFVASAFGRVQHFDGVSWSSTGAAGNDLWSISGTGPADVWAVGLGGAVTHFDGALWSTVDAGTTADLYAVWARTPGDVWAVGAGGLMIHWDGTSWTSSAPVTTYDLYGVWGSAANDVWAVGMISDTGSTIVHWDGSSWTAKDGINGLNGVWGSGPSDVWAVGSDIRHWDGVSWAVAASSPDYLFAVWGRAADDVWAVGSFGAVLHWDGVSWTSRVSGAQAGLYGLWGASATDVYAVGAGGTILRLQP